MEADDIHRVTILGTGMMGPGIALLFAKAGFETKLWGPTSEDLHSGEAHFKKCLEELTGEGVIDKTAAVETLENMELESDFKRAVREADFVSEAVVEDLEIKQEIFARLEDSCKPSAVLTSTTSTLFPSHIAAKIRDKSRMLVAHFWNPAYLVPLVEVCAHGSTSQEAVQITTDLLRKLNREPVLIKGEILGFIGNRLMHAMNREAISLVQKGIVEPRDIDRVVTSSFGPRFAHLGPMEYLDLIGLDLLRKIQGYLYHDLESDGGVAPIIEEKVNQGELGVKSGKGFYDWSGRDSLDLRKRRDRELLRRMKELYHRLS
jgi:3-hydroxybutyryl-CoA dehydrogenase